jgi:lipoprotein-anchoring transpeptidase ErfK/SrfK
MLSGRERTSAGASRAVFACALATLVAGCSEGSVDDAPALMRGKVENGAAAPAKPDWSLVPVPPETGPKLAPIAMVVTVRARPEREAEAVGYLRVGARVARSVEPVSKEDCPGGWYAVRPVGFVCAGPDVTLKLEHPIARAIQVEPDRSQPMPYKYAFVRAIAPNYLRVPSKGEQFQYEMRLERHLRNWSKLRDKWDALEVGANDVPLDEEGRAIGGIPDHAKPMDQSVRFGGNGDDTVPWWLKGGRAIPNLSAFKAPPYAVIADRLKRHAGVALIGTFVADEAAGGRRFAITTDARLVPADKLKADSGSPFHGREIRSVGLPAAFVRAEKAHFYQLEGGRFEKGEPVAHREFVPLTGNVRMSGGTRYVEARAGGWLRSNDLRTIAKSSSLPAFAKRGVRWIDVSILNQTLVLWEGQEPVYATLVSTGRDGLGDPKTTHSTPVGTFNVFQKHVTTTMDSDVADHEFELRDVPWVQYFKGSYALHAAYWHDDFGRSRSHGCINLSPVDARYVFMWTTPSVPEHWQGASAGGPFEGGTIVHIHP